MNELQTRTLSAAILGGAVLAITWASCYGFIALCLGGGVLLAREWWGLTAYRSRLFIPLGFVYLGGAVASLIFLRSVNANIVFALFALVWAGDIGGYLIGKRFGAHKIAPAISPGKSWEGLAGSILATAAVYALIGGTIPMSLLMGAVIALTGLGGDLFESSLKRHAGVKDSGALIPGHGGLLDRLDAVLAAAPAAALLGVLLGPGLPLWR